MESKLFLFRKKIEQGHKIGGTKLTLKTTQMMAAGHLFQSLLVGRLFQVAVSSNSWSSLLVLSSLYRIQELLVLYAWSICSILLRPSVKTKVSDSDYSTGLLVIVLYFQSIELFLDYQYGGQFRTNSVSQNYFWSAVSSSGYLFQPSSRPSLPVSYGCLFESCLVYIRFKYRTCCLLGIFSLSQNRSKRRPFCSCTCYWYFSPCTGGMKAIIHGTLPQIVVYVLLLYSLSLLVVHWYRPWCSSLVWKKHPKR